MKDLKHELYDILENMIDSDGFTEATEDEIDRTYKRVLEKTNMKDNRKIRRIGRWSLKAALVAAALTVCTVTAFAGYYSIKDIFPNVFREMNADGSIGPVEAGLPTLEKAGTVINESVENDNLKVTVKGAAGDSDTLFLAIDVESLDGSPLRAIGYESEPQGQLSFDNVFLRLEPVAEGEMPGQYCFAERIDDGSDLSKATFLISEKTVVENIVGKKAVLSFSNLMEYAGGQVVDMAEGASLYDLLNTAKPAGDDEYEINDFGDGKTYEIMKGDLNVELDNKYSGLNINNMGFRDGTFHLGLSGAEQFKGVIDGMALKRISDGEIIFSNGSTTIVDHSALNFPDIADMDALKDYVIVRDASKAYHPVIEGNWQLEFALGYEDTTSVYDCDGEIELSGQKMQINQIALSPISLSIKASADAGDEDIYGIWGSEGAGDFIKINMNDGTSVSVGSYGGAEYTNPELSMKFILPVVIDSANVKSIEISGTEFTLGK